MSSYRSNELFGPTSRPCGDKFLENLKSFHKSIGSPFIDKAVFAGKEVDLAALYRKVTSCGGCAQVTSQRKWTEIAEALKLPADGCVNSSYALRQFYLRYFKIYEKTNFFNEDLEDIISSGRLKINHATAYDRMASASIEGGIRTSDTLMLALESGLPNEVEFALHILIEMSYDTNKPFLIVKMPCFIRRLLAIVGLFEQDYAKHISNDRSILNVPEINFVKFWESCVKDNEIKRLIYGPFPDHRNIDDNSKEENNDDNLFDHYPGKLSRLAIDRLERISLESPTNYRTQILLKYVWRLIKSIDKQDILKGMEITAGLCENIDHSEVISNVTDSSIYSVVINYLTVPDVQLLITSLDVLCALTGLGEATCCQVLAVNHSIDLLVSLVSLDVHKFGEEAMAGIFLFDKRSQISASTIAQAQPPQVSSNNMADIAAIISPVVSRSAEEMSRIDRENENFAHAWLNATYDCCTGGYVPRSGMYSDYLATCNRLSITGIVNSTTFSRLIHEVFPSAEIKRVTYGNTNQYFYTGVRKRARPLPFTYTPGHSNVNRTPTLPVMNSVARTSTVVGTVQGRQMPYMTPTVQPYSGSMGNITANLQRIDTSTQGGSMGNVTANLQRIDTSTQGGGMGNITANLQRIDTSTQGPQFSIDSQKQNSQLGAIRLPSQMLKKTTQFVQMPLANPNIRNKGLSSGSNYASTGPTTLRQENFGSSNKVVASLSCDSTPSSMTSKDSAATTADSVATVHASLGSNQPASTSLSTSSVKVQILSDCSFRFLHPSGVSNNGSKDDDNTNGTTSESGSKNCNITEKASINLPKVIGNLQNGATLQFRKDITSTHDISISKDCNKGFNQRFENSELQGLNNNSNGEKSVELITSLKRKSSISQIDNKVNGQLSVDLTLSTDNHEQLPNAGITSSSTTTIKPTQAYPQVSQANGNCLNKLDTTEEDTAATGTSKQQTENATYLCKWNDCQRHYENVKDLASHVYNVHANNSQGFCGWEGCLNDTTKRVKRARFSMIFHLQKHIKNYGEISNEKITRKSYVPQAKIPLTVENELPLTKCVRLTAALTLRNLVKFTHEAKTYVVSKATAIDIKIDEKTFVCQGIDFELFLSVFLGGTSNIWHLWPLITWKHLRRSRIVYLN
ncbi:uncharacterized protein TRIADDRAFT_54817 [Trichoplax adhaerens]|uniref:ARID domain-containing protein n=1 Tax=Trichoplax adhaerens TaxID=10228 RepID=B3RT31_TRIAD|nr:hypothetical protein TRIADDRAFT_54817 [Trichoplax adhaerens]EDV27158.1 hypothetical protein TRIADDRAFT_54817 [Trichoplax adhaerens]|eukprot:XP_002111154.1 hypothetical protein TRIADDRAFT_54817 [Trichoplax adhaerens]